MKWILIITIFGADGDVTRVGHPFSSEEVCERAAVYQMEFYKREGVKAEYDCVPKSPFVIEEDKFQEIQELTES